jgi:hypothetical protein
MKILVFLPLLIQAIAISVDEFYFHFRRGLPLWERIGHPIDTASVLVCLLFTLFVPYSPLALKWYIALALFSCILVTKDEWIHKHHCPGSENWLHALLFLNHPVILTVCGFFWSPHIASWLPSFTTRHLCLFAQTVGVMVFMGVQIVYWNVWRKKAL